MLIVYIQLVICITLVIYNYFYKKEKDLLHPIYLFTLMHIFIFIIPPIFRQSVYYDVKNFNNQLARNIGLISLLSFILGYFVSIKTRKKYLNFTTFTTLMKQHINKRSVILMTIISFVITLIIFIYKVKAFGSIGFVLHNSFTVMTTLSKGKWFVVVLSSIFINSYYYFTAYCMENKAGKERWIWLSLYFIVTVLICGIQSRSTILSMLLVIVIYYNYMNNPIKIKYFLIVAVIAILGMFTLNVLRLGLDFSKAFNLKSLIASMLADTNPYENLSIALTNNSSERLWFKYLILVPISFIPRIIWHTKPDTVLEVYLMNKYITYPVNGTMTFTLPGSLFYNAGVIGIVIGMFIYAKMIKCIYIKFAKRGKKSYLGLMFYFILLTTLLNGYRLSYEGIAQIFIVTVAFYAPFLLYNQKIRRKAGESR